MPGERPLWHSGAELTLSDRGLQYGDGVFETLLVNGGRAWLLERHLLRLATAVARLNLCWPSQEQLRVVFTGAQAAMDRAQSAVLKLSISAAGEQRGYRRDPTAASLLRASLYPSSSGQQQNPGGLRLFQCQTRLASQPRLAGIKHLNRLEQVLAVQEWDPSQFDEGVMLDSRNNVAEATASNLIFARGGQLYTPALTDCGVHGVLRGALLADAGLQLRQSELAAVALPEVQGLWLTNSVQGLRPAASVRIDERDWPLPTSSVSTSTLASSLAASIEQLQALGYARFTDPLLLQRLRANDCAEPLLAALMALDE